MSSSKQFCCYNPQYNMNSTCKKTYVCFSLNYSRQEPQHHDHTHSTNCGLCKLTTAQLDLFVITRVIPGFQKMVYSLSLHTSHERVDLPRIPLGPKIPLLESWLWACTHVRKVGGMTLNVAILSRLVRWTECTALVRAHLYLVSSDSLFQSC